MAKAKDKASIETANEAMKVAKGTARPGQTKEQTKLIAQGIEKGIAEYKKREKAKARERDKERKKQLRLKEQNTEVEVPAPQASSVNPVPWLLLVISWLAFGVYGWFF